MDRLILRSKGLSPLPLRQLAWRTLTTIANGNHPRLQATRQHIDPLQPAIVSTLDRDQVVALLRSHKATLKQRFGVAEVALFGSYARNHAAENSDVDILVSFASPPDWRRYFGAQAYLEDLFGRPVDLATRTDIRSEIRRYVERELSVCDADRQGRE